MQHRKDNTDLAESTLFIGKLIEEELRRQERSVTWLSRKIHCDRRNVYDIFKAHGKKPVFSQCLDITSYICKKECDGEESLHRVGGMSTSGRND